MYSLELFISFILYPFKLNTLIFSELLLFPRLLVIIQILLFSFKKHADNNLPNLLIFVIFYMHCQLFAFHILILLSIIETDIIKSLLFILSKICLKFVIYSL